MDRINFLKIGSIIWVMDDLGALKMITVEEVVWNEDPDLQGWDIMSEGQLYWVESCYFLEYPLCEN